MAMMVQYTVRAVLLNLFKSYVLMDLLAVLWCVKPKNGFWLLQEKISACLSLPTCHSTVNAICTRMWHEHT